MNMNAPHSCRQQSGQAALEALIVMLALAVLWVGIAWLGRIQDLALQLSHGARYAAFMATRLPADLDYGALTRTAAFEGLGNQWSDRRGNALQNTVYPDVDVSFLTSSGMPSHDQIGGSDPRVVQLRDDWLGADQGVLSAQLSLYPLGPAAIQAQAYPIDHPQRDTGLKLYQFDAAYPVIHRHTSILTGSGHAGSDAAVAKRIAESDLAWSGPAEQSYRLGRRVAQVASRVDNGWGRPQPIFDWLGSWEADVPSHHLRSLP